MTPDLALELLKAGGVPALVVYLIMTNRQKAPATGNDAAAKLDAIHDRLIRMETKLDERLGK